MENNLLQKNIALMMGKGFERSARALSGIVQGPVSASDCKMMSVTLQDLAFGKQHNIIVLTTEIIGELSGRSYLILTGEDREKICKVVSPNSLSDDKFQEALLMEIDNIASAMVISQLADEMNIEVFGDVPQVHYTTPDKLSTLLASTVHESPSIVQCVTNFSFPAMGVHLKFIWKLSSKILEVTPSSDQ